MISRFFLSSNESLDIDATAGAEGAAREGEMRV
jgi:hypothetical protein